VSRLAAALVALAALGCSPPGRPTPADRYVPPTEVVEFAPLYALHCSGCHGADGVLGPARALHDPLYLALVPTEVLDRKIRAGVAGTPMPAFARSEGGPLTDAQVKALVEGLKGTWGGDVSGDLPAYAATSTGDPERGRTAFATFCGSCHGADGRGSEAARWSTPPTWRSSPTRGCAPASSSAAPISRSRTGAATWRVGP